MKYLLLTIFLSLNAASYERVKINQKLSKSISTNIFETWNASGGLCGGKFNPELKIVHYKFYYPKAISKVDIRKLYVEMLSYMLYVYNSNADTRLTSKYSNFPYIHENIQVTVYFRSNVSAVQIRSVSGFQNDIVYSYITDDNSTKLESETFDDAYFKLHGRKWVPFNYNCEQSIQ